MINSDFLVIDFEGFRHKSQQFIPKEISVRGANYQDTIILQPPVKFSLLAEENKKTYAWLTDNLHGIVWEAGNYDHTFIFNFFNALKLRFPNSTVFQKVPRSALSWEISSSVWSTWTLLVAPKHLSLAIVQQKFVRIIKSSTN